MTLPRTKLWCLGNTQLRVHWCDEWWTAMVAMRGLTILLDTPIQRIWLWRWSNKPWLEMFPDEYAYIREGWDLYKLCIHAWAYRLIVVIPWPAR